MKKKHKIEEAMTKSQPVRIAKRDFLIVQNEIRIEIRKGDDLAAIPERFVQNLKTEGVI